MQVQKYSSSLAQTTRVKRHRKTPRKTVGITLPPKLIEEARKKGLNISRICEEALKSVLDY
jgi:post-segregation antitoxin (ccd killing protein)